MPKGKEVDKLYLTLGLNMDEFDKDFALADDKTKKAVETLNREKRITKLKADIEINNAGVAKDSIKGIEIQMNHLGETIETQKKILAQYQLQYEATLKHKGEDSPATLRAEETLLKQEKYLSVLNKQYTELANIKPKDKGFLGKISDEAQVLQGKFSNLQNTIINFSMGIAAGFGLVSLVKTAVTAGNELYKLQTKLGTTGSEAKKIGQILQLSGVESSGFITAMSRLDRSYQSAGASGKQMRDILKDNGVVLEDENKKILPIPQQLERLAFAYEEAEKSGEGFEFAQAVFGRNAQAMIPVLDEYKTKIEAIGMVKSTGLAMNPEDAHKDAVTIQVLEMQIKQFGNAVGKVLAPLADDILVPLIRLLNTVADVMKEWKIIPSIITGVGVSLGSLKIASWAGKLLGLKTIYDTLKGTPAVLRGIYDTGKTMFTLFRTIPATIAGISEAITVLRMGLAGLSLNPIMITIGLMVAAYTFWQERQKEINRKKVESDKEATKAKIDGDKNSIESSKKLTAEEKEELKKRQEVNSEIQEQIYDLTHSNTEKQIYDIEKKAEKYKKDGADEVKVAQWVSAEKDKIRDEQEKKENDALVQREKAFRKNAVDIANLEVDNAKKEFDKTDSFKDKEKYLQAQAKYADSLMNLYNAQISQYEALGQFEYSTQKLLKEAESIEKIGGDSTTKRYEVMKQAINEYLSDLDKLRQAQIECWSGAQNAMLAYSSVSKEKITESGFYYNNGIKKMVYDTNEFGFSIAKLENNLTGLDSQEKLANTYKLKEKLDVIHTMLQMETLGSQQRKQLIENERSVFSQYTKSISDGIKNAMSQIEAMQSKVMSSANSAIDLLSKYFPKSSSNNMVEIARQIEKAWDSTSKHTLEQINTVLALKEKLKTQGIDLGVNVNSQDVMDSFRNSIDGVQKNIEIVKNNMSELVEQANQIGAQAANNFFGQWSAYLDELQKTIPIKLDMSDIGAMSAKQFFAPWQSEIEKINTNINGALSNNVELGKREFNLNVKTDNNVTFTGFTNDEVNKAVEQAKTEFGKEVRTAFDDAKAQYSV